MFMDQSKQRPKGLKWMKTTFSLEPRWTVEVDQELIKRELRSKLVMNHLDIEFLAQGALNKVYTVRAHDKAFVLRVSLPVDPGWKTTSEVATMEWVHHNTALPVPSVIAYEADQANQLGFEWVLMTKIPGTPLSSAWKTTSFGAKERIVRRLALFASNMFEKQWRGIGNIYPANGNGLPTNKTSIEVGRIVSMDFFWGERVQQCVPRGPFRTSREWMHARLSLAEGDCELALASSEDEDDLEDAERTLGIVKRLKSLLDIVFPTADCPEPSALYHNDLSQHNIMVDGGGILTGVVDWECVSTVPLWKACSYPSFLEGRARKLKPDKSSYKQNEYGEPDSLFWEHLLEHELTLLRGCFLGEMQALQPQWAEVFQRSQLQRDFEFAVLHSNSELSAPQINEWVDEITREHHLGSLCDRI